MISYDSPLLLRERRRINFRLHCHGDEAMQRLALTVSECTKVAGLGRTKIYQEIKEGRLRAVKLGRGTRILVDDLKHYLAQLPVLGSFSDQDSESQLPDRPKDVGRL